MEFVDGLLSYVADVSKLAQIGEVLGRTSADITAVVASLERVGEIDPMLAPELVAAIGQVAELSRTMERLTAFVVARHEVAQERFGSMLSKFNGEEGSDAQA